MVKNLVPLINCYIYNNGGILIKKYIYFTLCLIIMVIFFVIGNKEIMSSDEYGEEVASILVQENGGIDTVTYNRVYSENAYNYRLVGSIKTVLSGIGIIIFAVEIGRELKKDRRERDDNNLML